MAVALLASTAVAGPPAAADPADVAGLLGPISQADASADLSGNVPQGVCYADATVAGGGGGGTRSGVGGDGAEITVLAAAHPTQPYLFTLGAKGVFRPNNQSPLGPPGGFGAYGSGGKAGDTGPGQDSLVHVGSSGAGASAFYLGSIGSNELIAAGAGGGAGSGHAATAIGGAAGQFGGNAGLPTGVGVAAGADGGEGIDLGRTSSGQPGDRVALVGGQGGQAGAAGSGGVHPTYPVLNGIAGSGTNGGAGQNSDSSVDAGTFAVFDASIDTSGGGGAGYFGGGGGAGTADNGGGAANYPDWTDPLAGGGSGGGGGASYVAATVGNGLASAPVSVSSVAAGNGGALVEPGADGADGYASISFVPCDYDLTVTKVANPTQAFPGDTVTFTVVVTNNGPDHMTLGDTVTLVDDAATQFTNAPTNIVATHTTVGANSGLDQNPVSCTGTMASLDCSQTYGSASAAGVTGGGVRGLDVGGQITVTYDVVLDAADQVGQPTVLTNTVGVTDRNGTDTAQSTVTIPAQESHIEIEKTAGSPSNNGDGTYDITFQLEVDVPASVPTCANDGTGCALTDHTNVQVTDDLAATYGAGAIVAATSAVASGPCTSSAVYNGLTNTDLLIGTDTLVPGDACVITITVTVDAAVAGLGDYTNSATVTSDQDTDTDTADATLAETPGMDVTKTLTGGPTNNGDGTYDLEYTIDVVNTGDGTISNVQATDGLDAVFGTALISASQTTAAPCTRDVAYTGVALNINLLAGNDVLPIGGSCQIVVSVTVLVDSADPASADINTDYTNTATGSGTTPSGGPVGDTDDAITNLGENPGIDVVKSISDGPTNNGDGTYDLEYTIDVANTGDVDLLNVQVVDGLDTVFGNALVSGSQTTAAPCSADATYTGLSPNTNLLAGSDTLAVGESCQIVISVTITVDANNPEAASIGTDYTNNAAGSGTSPGGATANDDDDATTNLAESPAIDVAKSISAGPTNNGDGTYDLEYTIDVENTGDVDLLNVQVVDGLDATFGNALVSGSQSTAAPCTADATYTGVAPNTNLLAGTDTLAIGEMCQIVISVTITVDSSNPDAASIGTDYPNTAAGSGTSPSGAGANDSDTATTNLGENPAMAVVKAITDGPTNNGNGTYDIEYTIDVANIGDVDLLNLQVVDGLDTVFGNALVVGTQSAIAPCIANPAYTGIAPDTDLLTGTNTLPVGDSCQIVITVTVTVDSNNPDAASVDTDYTNTAAGSATSPSGDPVNDDDTATTNLGENPGIDVEKSVVGTPVNNGDGTHTIEYLITAQNTGDVDLLNVQVTDGLEAAFGASFQSATTSTALPCSTNGAYSGTAAGDVNLLSGTDTLAVGELCAITVLVTVLGDNLSPVSNTAAGSGTTPAGESLTDDDPADVTLTENPAVDIVKTVGLAPTSNNDGSFDMSWDMVITNTGDVPLSGAQVTDNLATTYVDAVSWSVTGTSLAALDTCTLNGAFNGDADQNLLDGTDTLTVGQTCTITINVTFEPGADLGPYTNNADVSGTSPGGQSVSDTDDEPVSVDESPAIDVVKTVLAPPVNDGSGAFTTTYQVTTTNTGDVPLSGVQVTDDLATAFASVASWSATAGVSAGACSDNAGFDGDADMNLLDGTDSLAVGESCTIDITVTFDPNGALGDYVNAAGTSGTSPGGEGVTDTDSTDQAVVENPAIDVTKDVLDPPGIVNNGDGTYDITYGVVVTNTGDVPLNNVQVTDDLTATFATAAGFDVDPASVTITAGPCTANSTFDGDADPALLSGTDSLVVGQSCSAEFPVTVTPGATLGVYTNDVQADGTSPGGSGVNDADDADATFPENPEISLTKDIVDPPAVVNNQDGTYSLTYRLVVTNTGDVPLNNVQVDDNVSATFVGATAYTVDGTSVVFGDPCTSSATYDGSTDIGLLAGTDTMAVGDVCTIDIDVTVTPGSDLGPYDNTAEATGTSPGGDGVSDVSQDGSDPDPEGDGPGDNSDPTPAWFTEEPQISLNKTIVGGVTSNGDGSYSTTYGLTVANSGNVPLYNVQVDDDLSATFAPAASWSADAVRVTAGTCTASTAFDGAIDLGTLSGSDSMAVADTCEIEIDVTVFPGGYLGSYDNTATAEGTSPGGADVDDISQDGNDADPEGDGPGDNSDPTPFSVTENPMIDVVKTVVGDPVNNGDGTHTIEYLITAENIGDVDLQNVQVTDGVEAAFGASFQSATTSTATPCSTNPAYSGTIAGDVNLLSGTDTLAIGETCSITVFVTVTGTNLGPVTNTAEGSGTSPGGQTVADDDPADVALAEDPAIEVVKTVGSAPTSNDDGSFDMSWELVVTNIGDIVLNNVQVSDALAFTYADAVSWSVTGTTLDAGSCTLNGAFDGSADVNLLDGSDSMEIGASCTVTIDVTFEPGADLGPYANNAGVSGTSPGGEGVNDTDDDETLVDENPAIDIVKTVLAPPVNDGTGTFTTTYQMTTTNTGDVPLNNVQVVDDLAAAFAGVASWSATSAVTAGACTDNAAFDGEVDMNVLAGTDGLAVGASCTIDITVTFDPNGALGDYVNAASTAGVSPGGEGVTDSDSTDQAVEENPAIDVTKDVLDPPGIVNNQDGTYGITYGVVVTNVGDVPLNNVQVTDDLTTTFAPAVGFDVDPAAVTITAGACLANTAFDGDGDQDLLDGSDTLAVNESCSLSFLVTVTPGGTLGVYDNDVEASGTSPAGEGVDDADDALGTFPENPEISLTKDIVEPPAVINNQDGTYTLTYRLVATNTGDVPLNDVQVNDDLDATFASAAGWSFVATSVAFGDPCASSATYDGSTDIGLLAGTDTMAVGDVCTIDIEVTVTPGADLGPYDNTATAAGTSPGGEGVTDVSQDGTDPDAEGDGPGDNSDPTPAWFTEEPLISLNKTIVGTVTSNGDGSYSATYGLTVANSGNVPLSDVQVDDDLSVTFAPAASWSADAVRVTSGLCTASTTYDGSANVGTLAGTDTMAVADTCDIEIDVTVFPGSYLGSYDNTATADGTSPAGQGVSDVSQDGNDADPEGDGPGDNSDPTPLSVNEDPSIDVIKSVVGDSVNNGDGTHTVEYLITAQNTGDVELRNVQVADGLEAVFGAALVSASTSAAAPCTTNPAYTGTAAGDLNLLSGTDTIVIGETCGITVTITVTAGDLGPHTNTATGTGTSPGGVGAIDDDPADVLLDENPAIDIVKSVGAEPTSNNDGSFDMTWNLVIENTGDVVLNDVQITDDLTATYADAVSWSVTGVSLATGDCTPNITFNGDVDTFLLAGDDSMIVGETCSITFDVTFVPGADLGPYTNSASVGGTSPAGEGVDDTADADATVVENPAIDIVKTVLAPPVNDGTGTFTTTYQMTTTNTGDVPLSNVQVVDDLAAAFAGVASWSATSAVTAGACTDNAGFTGDTDMNVLAGTDSLAVGDSCTIDITVTFDPNGALGEYVNAADTSGTSPGGEGVTDADSTDQEVEENPAISVTKDVLDPPGIVNNQDGTYDITYGVVVTNTGDVPLNDVQLTDDLTATFATAVGFDVDPGSLTVTAGPCSANTTFDGDADQNLLDGSDSLVVGQSCSVSVPVTVTPGGTLGTYTNVVLAAGTSPAGEGVDDADDADGDFPENPEISLTKDIIEPPAVVNNEDGSYTLTYRLVATNTGDVPLNSVQVEDDLSATFADAAAWSVNETSTAFGDPCEANPAFDGSSNTFLLVGTDTMAVGDVCTIDIEVTVTPGADLGPYDNTATAEGVSPGGEGVTDVSQDGADPDAEGDGPGDNSDPTPAWFTEEPQISLNKTIVGGATNNGDGTYDVTYGLTVANSGNVPLYNVQVDDDLSATFAPAASWSAGEVRVTSGQCTASTTFDGGSDIGTLAGTDSMAVGDTCSIEVDATFAPGAYLGSYDNTATADGTSPAGEGVSDVSQDGDDADPEGDGPGDNSDPTPLSVSENPAIDVVKTLVGPSLNNGDGTHTVDYTIVVTNTGDTDLLNVQVTDGLEAVFGEALLSASTTAVDPCSANPAYTGTGGVAAVDDAADPVVDPAADPVVDPAADPAVDPAADPDADPAADAGAGDVNLLTGTDTLATGESCLITVTVIVEAGDLGPHTNTAAAVGTSPGGESVNGDDPEDVTLAENPAIDIVKTVGLAPTSNNDGSFDMTWNLVVTNTGDVVLRNVQVADALAFAYATATSWSVTGTSVGEADLCTLNALYDGSADVNLLDGTDSMIIGQSCELTIAVTFEPGADLGPYTNNAGASGTSPGGEGVDDSDDEDVLVVESPAIDIVKTISVPPVNDGSGTFTTTYQMTTTNTGDVPLNNVQVTDDLAAAFVGVASWSATSAVTAGMCTDNAAFDGEVDMNVLAGTDGLAVGESCTIDITVTFDPNGALGEYVNAASTSGVSPGGEGVTDVDSTDQAAEENPEILVEKNIADPGIITNLDGTYDITYGVTVTNTGDVPLNNVQLTDDLTTAFASAVGFDIDPDAVAVTAGPCTPNDTFDGVTDLGLLEGTDRLVVGQSCSVTFLVTVTPGGTLGTYTNDVAADGVSPAGESVADADDVDNEFTENPEISLTKDLVEPPAVVSNEDGSYTLTYRLVATNTGDITLENVQVVDDMSATYADAVAWDVTGTSIPAADPCSTNPTYDGLVNKNLLAGGDSMAVGDTCTIDIDILVTPGADLGPYDNSATADGTSPGGQGVSDISQDGTVSDAEGDGPGDNSDPTPAFFGEDPQISLNKAIVGEPTNNSDGTYTVTYGLDVLNSGNIPLNNVQVDDDLSATFASAISWAVDAVRVTSGDCSASTTYDGSAVTGTLVGNDSMAVGDTCTIEIDVTFEPGSFLGSYDNTATADGISPAGVGVSDVSQDGADSDPEGDGPGDNSEPTPLSVGENPEISLTKDVVVDPVSNGDGTYTLSYGLVATNTGDVSLSDVQVDDDLSTTFAEADGFTVDAVAVTAGNCSPSTSYDGAADTGTLTGSDTMAVGASCTITIEVTVTPGAELGPFNNTARAAGVSPAGENVADVSQDGTESDVDRDGDPGNDSDPTPVAFGENPELELTKSVVGTPTMNSDGSFTVSYEMDVSNTGDVDLDNVTLTDDLSATFGEDATFEIDAVTVASPLVANDGNGSYSSSPNTPTLFNGTTILDLISDESTLAIGESATVTVTVTVTGAGVGMFKNQASTSGTSPAGQLLQDLSPAEIAVDALEPEITTTKELISGPIENRDGTFRLVYEITVLNSGVIDLASVQVADDLDSQWDIDFTVVGTTSSTMTVEPSFNGKTVTNLLAGEDELAVGESGTVELTVDVERPDGNRLENQAVGTATDVLGLLVVNDNSQDGAAGDPDNDGDPTNNNVETVALFEVRNLAFVDPTPTPAATAAPGATVRATSTPRPAATARPTSTPRPAATARPTATPRSLVVRPTATPRPTQQETPRNLAFTGAESLTLALVGAGLLAAGAAFVGASRRRKEQ